MLFFFLGGFALSKVMAEVMKSIKPHLTDAELQELFASDSVIFGDGTGL